MKDYSHVYDVLIIGGGLAGLSAAIHLTMHDVKVILIEKNDFPKHKVCGEYISNEVLPYLNYLGIDVFELGAKKIDTLEMSTPNNNHLKANLPLGGFGISRYTLDNSLFLTAKHLGVKILHDTVDEVHFLNDEFSSETKMHGVLKSKIVIGAYGKRSSLDLKLDRPFIKNKSPYLAVKLHVKGDFPDNVVALHNFKGGIVGFQKWRMTVLMCVISRILKRLKDLKMWRIFNKTSFTKTHF